MVGLLKAKDVGAVKMFGAVTRLVGIVIGVSVVVAGCGSTSESDPPFQTRELLPVLSVEQSEADRLDDVADEISDTPIDPDSVRFLGASGYGQHWAAIDTEGYICVITKLDDTTGAASETSGTACGPPTDFYLKGTFLSVGGDNTERATTVLLPHDVDTASVAREVKRINGDTDSEGAFLLDETPSTAIVMSSEAAATSGDLELERADGEALVVPLGR